MVRSALALVMLAGSAAHAAALTAQVDKAALALGEPLTLTLAASGLELDALDLAPLAADFEVFSRTRSRSADSETLVLTLYPRAAGALSIPPLRLGSRRTAALPLAVADGSDRVPRVSARWELAPAAPGVGEPARLTLAICDDGSLQWRRPVLPTRAGRVLRTLGEDEGRSERAGEACTLQRFHWALLATRAGAGTVELPMLDAGRFGQRLRFPVPALAYSAAALPAWLPAQVPPVAAAVRTDPLPARWSLNQPLAWRFEVAGGYSADALKTLLDLQLRDTPELGWYPPLIEEVAPADSSSPLPHYAVTLFLVPRASGALNLPTLTLPWYDPVQERMAATALPGPSLAVFDPRWQRAAQAAGGLAGVLLLAGLVWQARRMARWRLARRRGLGAIAQARDMQALARAVRQFSLAGQPEAHTLGEWSQRMQRECKACDAADAVRRLQQQLFGQAAFTLGELQHAFSRSLARARPQSRSCKSEQDGSRGVRT